MGRSRDPGIGVLVRSWAQQVAGGAAGVGLVEPGQRVDVEIEGIGTLSNTFVRR